MNQSQQILESWQANAENWISTIDNAELESRTLATNNAIVKAILEYAPAKIIDIGCGEGWLTRELRKKGMNAYGVDAIDSLIENAKTKDGDYYYRFSYEEIASGQHSLPGDFDAAVINFALIDKEATENLIHYLPTLLQKKSLVFIQTLHPLSIDINDEYASGWKKGSWNGMKRDFTQPYDWYFRILEDWMKLFFTNNYSLVELREPIHPVTKKPLSVIFILRTE